jgi:hypothetical protein
MLLGLYPTSQNTKRRKKSSPGNSKEGDRDQLEEGQEEETGQTAVNRVF